MTEQGYPFNPDYGPDGRPLVKSLENAHADRVWRDKHDHEWRWLHGRWKCRRGGMWTDAWAPSESFGPFTEAVSVEHACGCITAGSEYRTMCDHHRAEAVLPNACNAMYDSLASKLRKLT